MARSSSDSVAKQYVCTSGFVDDVMFSHDGQEYRRRKKGTYTNWLTGVQQQIGGKVWCDRLPCLGMRKIVLQVAVVAFLSLIVYNTFLLKNGQTFKSPISVFRGNGR